MVVVLLYNSLTIEIRLRICEAHDKGAKMKFSVPVIFCRQHGYLTRLETEEMKVVLIMKFPSFLVHVEPCQPPQRECTMHKQEAH